MEATRVRAGAIVEWILAAAFIAIALAVGSIVMREFTAATAVMPVSAREASAPAPPAGVPPRTVSVPVLLLSDGKEVHVGDGSSEIARRLGQGAQVGAPSVERAPEGERHTRFYEYAGTRFVLVFEPFERGAEPRVAAIYLQ